MSYKTKRFNNNVRHTIILLVVVYLCVFQGMVKALENKAETKLDFNSDIGLVKSTPEHKENVALMPYETVKQRNHFKRLHYLYRSKIIKKVYTKIIYPSIAIDRNWEDNVKLRVVVDREGRVQRTEFSSKSKYQAFNKSVLKAIAESAPFKKIPEELLGEEFEFTLNIKFRLTG